MIQEQAKLVYEMADDTVLTLDGLYAHAFPCEEGVLISNNPFTDEENYDEVVVPYNEFYQVVNNNNGKFTTK